MFGAMPLGLKSGATKRERLSRSAAAPARIPALRDAGDRWRADTRRRLGQQVPEPRSLPIGDSKSSTRLHL
jgi:hypothetical protein